MREPNKCAYRDCDLPAEPTGSLCILHDSNPDKAPERFREALGRKIKVNRVDLSGVVFPVPFDFSNRAIGPQKADFRDAHFLKEAHFERATFQELADFSGAIFDEGAFFESALFPNSANFYRTTFNAAAVFTVAVFGSNAVGAEGIADFTLAMFKQTASLDATFLGRVRFNETRFEGNVKFWGATFHHELAFRSTAFPVVPPCSLDFGNVTLFQPDAVFFEHVNLSRASFLCTDMSRVRLVGVEWGPLYYTRWNWVPSWFLGLTMPALYDERRLEGAKDIPADQHLIAAGKEGVANYRLVELLYRQIRINLETGRELVEAGQFYVGEMEMRRRNPGPILWGPKWGLQLYWMLGCYGESFYRPLFWYLAVGLLFAFLYLWAGFTVLGEQVQYNPAWTWALTWEHLSLAWLGGLTAAILPLGQGFQPWGAWGTGLRLFNLVLDVLLIALVALVVGRRFKR